MIILSEIARQSIAQHAEASYPNECVGLLIGRIDGKQKSVEAIHQAPNNWSAGSAKLYFFKKELNDTSSP